jgi:peptidoglycan/xylan/chitin deacetylase (PgdA/CDA1 family)
MQVHLGFHGLGPPAPHIDDDERPYWLAADRCQAILDVVTDAARNGAEVGLTFDDGNRSDVEVGLPALLSRGLSAAFFIVTDRIGRSGYLGSDDIRALRRAGMSVGSHGLGHVPWTTLSDAEIARHVSISLATLSEVTGERVDRVSIPFGAYDGRVLAVLRRLGVARVYNSDFGPAWPDAWMVARNSMRNDTPLDEIRALVGRRWGMLDAARARLRQWRRSRAPARGAHA